MDRTTVWNLSVAIDLLGHIAIIGYVYRYCWINRRYIPRTAYFLLFAVTFRSLPWIAQIFHHHVDWLNMFYPTFRWGRLPSSTEPEFWRMLAVQLAYAICNAISWSLIAWAVLTRPDRVQRRPSE